jgi:RHS repeat-associated protein
MNFSFQQIYASYVQSGEIKAPHELLSVESIIRQPGFAYVFLSNENAVEMQIGFDDYEVTHAHSDVIQQSAFYPFGLTYEDYSKEGSLEQRWKFQKQEHINDLGLGWVQFKWRNAMPELGRFFNIDPLSEKYVYNSTYAFSENKVTNHIELEGLEAVFAQFEGRVSIPLSPMLVGVTGSVALGVAINLNDGKGMIYKTTSIGIQSGIYAGGGLEFGAFPTGSIDNIKGLGVNAGFSMTPAIIAGEPFGPDVGAEINVTIPTNSNGEIEGSFGDVRLGGTVAIPGINWSAGATGYLDFSKTSSLVEFNVKDGVKALKENIQGLYDQLKKEFKSFSVGFEDFQKMIMQHYSSWQQNQQKKEDNEIEDKN